MATDTAELTRYEARLLLWLLAESDGRAGIRVPTAEFGVEQNIPRSYVVTAAGGLQERGLAEVHERRSRGPVVSLPEAGLAAALRMEAERDAPELRRRYAENALLAWAFAHRGAEALRLRDFLTVDQIFFHGVALTVDEVMDAARYLRREELLSATRDDVDAQVELTGRGLRCASAGLSIEEFIGGEARNRPPVTLVVSIPQLTSLIDRDGPELQLDGDTLDQLLRQAEELRRLDAERAERGSVRTHLDGIRQQLLQAPRTMARETLLDQVQQALLGMLG